MIDFHNHVLAGVDDGAASDDDTRAALAAFAAQGVTAVVATPHFRGSLLERPAEAERTLAEMDAAWDRARAIAAAEFPALRLERGVELMLDTPAPDLSDERLRLAGTRFALVEFPFMSVPPFAENALFELQMRGWTPVIAHPERYGNVDAELRAADGWKRVGAALQVNAGSIIGKYGPEAREKAWALLRRGMADFVCSDYHARGIPHSQACRAALESAGGAEQARLLMDQNPASLLSGLPPQPVPPLQGGGGLLRRIFGR